VEQHVVAAQQARRDRQQAGALDEGGPRSRAARGVLASASRSAAPNAAVQPPATRKPASMIHGSPRVRRREAAELKAAGSLPGLPQRAGDPRAGERGRAGDAGRRLEADR
jgi:hypothetical protein